jgi:hypothetical protein
MFQFLILVSVVCIIVAWVRTMPSLPAPPECKSIKFSQNQYDELDPIAKIDNDEWFFYYNDL